MTKELEPATSHSATCTYHLPSFKVILSNHAKAAKTGHSANQIGDKNLEAYHTWFRIILYLLLGTFWSCGRYFSGLQEWQSRTQISVDYFFPKTVPCLLIMLTGCEAVDLRATMTGDLPTCHSWNQSCLHYMTGLLFPVEKMILTMRCVTGWKMAFVFYMLCHAYAIHVKAW
jgi:hypothetical protein